MKSLDYNCLYDDITKTKIKTKFDIIIVGELIEHIQRLDLLMKNLKKLLNKNGKSIFLRQILMVLCQLLVIGLP